MGWRVLLPALSAVLLIPSFPPFRVLPLPFMALVPLAVALGSLEHSRGSGRTAALLGLVFGGLFWGPLLSWVPLVVGPQFPWAFPGYGAQVGLLAGLASLMAWGTHRLRVGGVPLPLAFPLAWVSMEWVKGHFPLGLAFPWLDLGISLTAWPSLLGTAEWTGGSGVSFWLAAVNGLLASAVLSRRGGEAPRGPAGFLAYGALTLAVAVGPGLAGWVLTRNLSVSPGPLVAVVGTAVPRDLRLVPVASTLGGLAGVREAWEQPEGSPPDLVVLPEATVGVPLEGPEGRAFRDSLAAFSRAVGAPLLVGALGRGPTTAGGGPDRATNSLFLIGPEGRITGRYDKVRLVPGMEWGGYSPGSPGTVLDAGNIVVGPLICYESLFPGLARAQVGAGAELLANASSDVWFGQGVSGYSSLFLHQHAAHLVMRAVETRTGVARAANGGFSLLLGPSGEPLSFPVPPSGGAAVARVPDAPGKTFFVRAGDLVGLISFLGVLFLLGLPRGRGSSRRR